jgi:hypothetical protein
MTLRGAGFPVKCDDASMEPVAWDRNDLPAAGAAIAAVPASMEPVAWDRNDRKGKRKAA